MWGPWTWPPTPPMRSEAPRKRRVAPRSPASSARHDGRVEPHDHVAAHGAGAEAGREEAHRAVDDAVGDRVVDRERDGCGGRVADRLDVEVEALGWDAGAL